MTRRLFVRLPLLGSEMLSAGSIAVWVTIFSSTLSDGAK